MKEYTQHEIGKCNPKLKDWEYESLRIDIEKNGVRQPITLYHNKILDGWHRYSVCKELGIVPTFNEYTGSQPAAFVKSSTEHRNMTQEQRSCQHDLLIPWFTKETAKKNKEQSIPKKGQQGFQPVHNSLRQQAKDIGVDQKTKRLTAKLCEDSPLTHRKLLDGETTLSEIKKNEKQKKLDEYHQRERSKKDTTKVKINAEDIQLHNCDILDAPIEDNSIDVIITDPPYPKEYLDCWNKLAEFAAKKLKTGGVLIAMSGQSYLPEVYKRMTIEGLDYYWTSCIKHTVGTDLHTKRVKTQWKPLLWYVKGKYTKTFQNTDVYTPNYSDTAAGQDYHKWGQSLPLFEEFVDRFTYAKDIVCDPFLGGGTTAIACINKKRKFIGVELDKKVFKLTSKRIDEVLS